MFSEKAGLRMKNGGEEKADSRARVVDQDGRDLSSSLAAEFEVTRMDRCDGALRQYESRSRPGLRPELHAQDAWMLLRRRLAGQPNSKMADIGRDRCQHRRCKTRPGAIETRKSVH